MEKIYKWYKYLPLSKVVENLIRSNLKPLNVLKEYFST